MKETEMDKIAREARAFREGEAKRIAAEKEQAKKEATLRSQLERERVAFEATSFRKNATNEQEALSRIRELGKRLKRQEDLLVSSDVAMKAKQFSEKEESERKRMEDEKLIVDRRSPKKSTSNVSDAESVSTFASKENGDNGVIDGDISRKSTVYFDATMSQSDMEPGSSDGETGTTAHFPVSSIKKQETSYFDAPDGEIHSKNEKQSLSFTSGPGEDSMLDYSTDKRPSHAQTQLSSLDEDTSAQSLLEGEERIVRYQQQYGLRPKRQRRDYDDGDEPNLHVHVQEAFYEIPIEYSHEQGFTVGKDSQLSMKTSIAPSRVDGKWSGTLEGRAKIGPSLSYEEASGSVTMDYSVNSWSRLSIGMIRGQSLFHPLITLGGSLIRQGSTLGFTFYHNASFLHAMLLEHSMYSVYFYHHFPKSPWFLSTSVSRKQELSIALTNQKLSTKIDWSLRNPKTAAIRLDMYPTISADRILHIFGGWKLGVWQIGCSLVQSLHSSVATVGLGVRLYSMRGLEWILSWTRGNATVRLPIVVSGGIAKFGMVQVLYFSMVSFLLQEGIAEMWGWKCATDTKQKSKDITTSSICKKKARQDAEVQKKLMARQAGRKKRIEAEKEGLVIHKAMYSLQGGDEYDVTIPLQFWVTRSALSLSSKSKSHLLGFYNLAEAQSISDGVIESTKILNSLSKPWWRALWHDLSMKTTTKPLSPGPLQNPKPTLQVQYEFQGQAYMISVNDDQELVLPNPKAVKM